MLTRAERARLGLAMLGDVLKATSAWGRRLVVTADASAAALAWESGCKVLPDPGRGLNAAVAAGAEAASRAGAERLLVLPADIPEITPGAVKALLTEPAPVVIAPSRDGGTNALLMTPPGIINPAFGPGSADAHRRAASAAGVQATLLDLPCLSLDIDDYEDLTEFAGRGGGQTALVAQDLLALGAH